MRQRLLLHSVVICAALAVAAVPPALGNHRGTRRVPDLVPWPRSFYDYRISREDGRVLLRFSAGLVNVGDGPLEVLGRRRSGRRTMEASQRYYAADGRLHSREDIGAFEYHREHNHWHVLKIAEYRLLDPAGQPVGSSNKVSFCLIDEYGWYLHLPGAAPEPQYEDCQHSRSRTRIRQGLSVGWTDVYSSSLPGQWVDITGVPPGQYLLQTEVNPDGIIEEKTRDNNTISVVVTIS